MNVCVGAFKNPHDFLRYKTREKAVIDEMKIYGKVKDETWESYLESEKVTSILCKGIFPDIIHQDFPYIFQEDLLLLIFIRTPSYEQILHSNQGTHAAKEADLTPTAIMEENPCTGIAPSAKGKGSAGESFFKN